MTWRTATARTRAVFNALASFSQLAPAFFVASALSGCAVVESHHLGELPRDQVLEVSQVYSLPTTRLILRVISPAAPPLSTKTAIAGFSRDAKGACLEASKICSEVRIIADPRFTYALIRNSNVFNDQKLTLTIDPNTGLLKSAATESTSKLAEILVTAVRTAGGDIKPPTAFTTSAEPKQIDLVALNPNDPRSVAKANGELRKHGLRIHCEGECKERPGPTRGSAGMIYSRTPRPIALVVSDVSTKRRLQVFNLVSVNGSPILGYRLDGALFASGKRSHSVTLVDGVVTESIADTPSEALGLVKLPGELIGAAILSPFSGLVTRSNAEKSALEAEKNLLTARYQLAAERERLAAEQQGAKLDIGTTGDPLPDREEREDDQEGIDTESALEEISKP